MANEARTAESARRHVIVLGATGRTGLELVQQALARGYAVTAVVRDPTRLGLEDGNLQIAVADMLKPDEVRAALDRPADAVVSALGIFPRKPSTELSDGFRHVLDAMQAAGHRRLVCITSFGCGDTARQAPLLLRWFAFGYLFRYAIQDKDRQEDMVRNSGLDYTIVRPAGLYDGESPGEPLVWEGDKPAEVKRFKVSRRAVAEYCLNSLDDANTIGRTVIIAE